MKALSQRDFPLFDSDNECRRYIRVVEPFIRPYFS